jgi:hypothetical protein
MARIYPGIECAICNRVISDDLLDKHEFVATTHFIGDSVHHLWRFSDAAMHKHCFVNWEHRQEFVQLYNDTRGNGTDHHMSDDGEIIEDW